MTGVGTRLFAGVFAVLVAAFAVVAGVSAAPQPMRADSVVLVNATVPQRAWDTLAKIDAGEWPPNDGSGTHGGTTWTNREGTLPRTDGSGNPIHYLEWDVNRKLPGHNRDAERIVTGSDGSAWYTGDHYATFTRMR
ncbi:MULTISPECIES: ribonuclease domain-containing protein [unclassified Nocardia]|uniref:ribonuclease domain-containing protein n=1 Tax=unclassified Nocardia TaxID=2637762 RepID=UPI001CE40E64|nr:MULTISPECIES: ribonuclease domain-containing protein [unclassified Nocardia]